MIGRHHECQIRPHSNSVSERHCLLEHRHGLLRVFDLESQEGTFVNNEKLEPHKWRFLTNGDQLRCGKLEFFVCIDQPRPPAERSSESRQTTKQSVSKNGKGEPAAARAVAGETSRVSNALLDTEPVPAKSRHDAQSANGPTASDLDDADDMFDALVDDEVDVDFADDEDATADVTQQVENPLDEARAKASEQLDGLFEDDDEETAEAETEFDDSSDEVSEDAFADESSDSVPRTDNGEKSEEKPKKSLKPVKTPKIPKVKRSSSRSFSLPSFDFSDTEKLKLVGAILLTIATISLFGYQLYSSSSSSPTTRIIQEEF